MRVHERAAVVRRIADVLARDSEAHAQLITAEMRKTIRSARAEIAKCVAMTRYFAGAAERLLADEEIPTEASRSFVRHEPLGTILGVMPWNFPFWQVFRFAIPALLAGNSVVVKHASLVPGCAAALERVMDEAGLPEGLFSAAALPASAVARLVADERVRAVVVTAGQEAGSVVGALAGRHVKKVVLELGGSDAFIVLPSANLDLAIPAAVRSRLHCNGQACTAAKRFIIHEAIAPEFESRLVDAMKSVRVGDPRDDRTDLGPLATREAACVLGRQVEESVARGARLRTGGRLDETYFAPTVLTNVPLDTRVAQEETFGPVAAVFRARDLDDAIRIANSTRYGLGASVWTSDEAEWQHCVTELDVGSVFVNAIVSSDPRLPFGGTKDSGFGRELGLLGIRELTNTKTVWIS
jgi:succinate-semialdehyde dehydrogenase/glutarate-semialdehyde dehydrogenase